MNAKNFTILAILTLAGIVAVVMLMQEKTTTATKEKLFPDLLSTINEVTEINIATNTETITMVRGEDKQWLLKEKHNYPASVEQVHKLLLGAADLTTLEAKTSNQALYTKIGVEDISAENAKSSQLTLKTGAGKTVASVIVGNDRVAKTDSTQREIYVRKPDKKATWLTIGQLSLKTELTDWLDKQIIDVNSDDVRQVSITQPDGNKYLLLKETPKDEKYQVADLPANAKIKLPYLLDNIAATLTRLDMDDVVAASEAEFDDEASGRSVFTTFDGLEITMTTVENGDDKYYAKFAAAFNPDAVFVEPEPTEEPATTDKEAATQAEKVDAKKQVETLNAKLNNWVYVLSKYKAENLYKEREELIELEEPPVDEEAEDLPASLGTPSTADAEYPFGPHNSAIKTLVPVPSSDE